jgi:hypothetical protein
VFFASSSTGTALCFFVLTCPFSAISLDMHEIIVLKLFLIVNTIFPYKVNTVKAGNFVTFFALFDFFLKNSFR